MGSKRKLAATQTTPATFAIAVERRPLNGKSIGMRNIRVHLT